VKKNAVLFSAVLLLLLFLATSPILIRGSGSVRAKSEEKPEIVSLLGKNLYATPADGIDGQELLKFQKDLEEAKKSYDADPNNPENIILYGNSLANLWRFHEAIHVFSKGIEKHPGYAMLYRYRGHRYISVRDFDNAVADLTKAAELNDHDQEIWYHLGLAHYLKGNFEKALSSYENCLKYATDDDSKISTSNWLYETLNRLGKKEHAARVLDSIPEGMKPDETSSYYNLFLFFKGLKAEKDVEAFGQSSELDKSTTGYGLGCWYLFRGENQKAKEHFEKAVAGKFWSAFGMIAAEVELLKMGK